jgi:membrane protease YdiL (CAAX protease family)
MSERQDMMEEAGVKEPWFPAVDFKCAVILTLGVLLLLAVHYARFPWLDDRYRLFAWFGLNVVLLLIVPLLVIRFVFKERVASYGFQMGDARLWGKYLGLFLLVFIPCALIASRLPQFADYYPRYHYARENHLLLIPSSLGWLAYFAAWEFFFRGFMTMGLGKRLGAIAIFIQMVPFTMAHFPKPELESLAAIIAGVALGLMAWKSKSFVGPWLLHWFAATTLDIFVVFWPLR